VAGKAWLTDRLNRRLTRIVQEKGLTCPDCGSSGPVPMEEGLRTHPDGGAEVPMCCEECEGASEMVPVLSPEEAKALGLHSLGDRPEASWRSLKARREVRRITGVVTQPVHGRYSPSRPCLSHTTHSGTGVVEPKA
jgi:hypothetical protein